MKYKYYLIKEKIVGDEKDLGNCLISINGRVELTEEELLILTNVGSLCGPSKEVETYYKTSNKIRKVLE